MNPVRQQLQSGQASLGCFMGLGSPTVTELLGYAGFDWLVIETEHNALGPGEIQHMLMAMNGSPTVPIVRVPSMAQPPIQNALDIGARGIMVPMLRTPEEVASVVAATRYPPRGNRGFGPLRATHYNYRRQEYYATADEEMLVVMVVETREAWENLEAIAQVPGLDVMFLGMSDLSLSLGLDLMRPDPAAVAEIEQRILEVGKRHNVAVGSGASTQAQVERRVKQGFSFVGCADHAMLVDGAAAFLGSHRNNAPRTSLC